MGNGEEVGVVHLAMHRGGTDLRLAPPIGNAGSPLLHDNDPLHVIQSWVGREGIEIWQLGFLSYAW